MDQSQQNAYNEDEDVIYSPNFAQIPQKNNLIDQLKNQKYDQEPNHAKLYNNFYTKQMPLSPPKNQESPQKIQTKQKQHFYNDEFFMNDPLFNEENKLNKIHQNYSSNQDAPPHIKKKSSKNQNYEEKRVKYTFSQNYKSNQSSQEKKRNKSKDKKITSHGLHELQVQGDQSVLSFEEQNSWINYSQINSDTNQKSQVFERLYDEGKYKLKIQSQLQKLHQSKQKLQQSSSQQKSQILSKNNENLENFYQRQQNFLQKKEEKIKAWKIYKDLQEEQQIQMSKIQVASIHNRAYKSHKTSQHDRQNSGSIHKYDNSDLLLSSFDESLLIINEKPQRMTDSNKIGKHQGERSVSIKAPSTFVAIDQESMVQRMQVDIERRRINQETATKMKKYQEQKQLKGLFVPKINKSNNQDKDQEHSQNRQSVFERMNVDAQRRIESQSRIRQLQMLDQQKLKRKAMKQSLSREKSLKKIQDKIMPNNNEKKLREALNKGVSALDIWKMMGDQNDLSKGNTFQSSLDYRYNSTKDKSIIQDPQYSNNTTSQQSTFNQCQSLKSITKNFQSQSIKSLSGFDRSICPSSFIPSTTSNQAVYQQVQKKLVEKNQYPLVDQIYSKFQSKSPEPSMTPQSSNYLKHQSQLFQTKKQSVKNSNIFENSNQLTCSVSQGRQYSQTSFDSRSYKRQKDRSENKHKGTNNSNSNKKLNRLEAEKCAKERWSLYQALDQFTTQIQENNKSSHVFSRQESQKSFYMNKTNSFGSFKQSTSSIKYNHQ